MKSLSEQIQNKCIHFNGIMNKSCKAGVMYADVRVDRPYKFPYLKQGGVCDKCQFPTEKEVTAKISEIKEMGQKELIAMASIKEYHNKTLKKEGFVMCSCGGVLQFAISDNNHIRGKCHDCGLAFME